MWMSQSVHQLNIHDKIRDILAEPREGFDPGRRLGSEEDLMLALQQRGIVDDVMKDLTLHIDSVVKLAA